MKKRKNKNQEPLPLENKIEIPKTNKIEGESIPTAESIVRLQSQNQSPDNLSVIFLRKINNGLGILNSVVQIEKASNPTSMVMAWSFLGCAILTNLVSLYLYLSSDFLGLSISTKIATLLWVISVVLAGISACLFSPMSKKDIKGKTKNHPVISSRKNYIQRLFGNRTFQFLAPILLLAFILRIIPIMNNGLYLDEWYWLDAAKNIFRGFTFSPFGFVGDQPSNMAAYPIALLLAVTKNSMLSVRLPAVIYSLISIFFVFELLKEILGFRTAVIGALLLAVSVWDIHMTNLGYNNLNPNPMLASGALLLLYKIYSGQYSIRTLFLLALFISICLHLLYVAALLLIPTLLVLAIHFLKKPNVLKLGEVALFGAFFLICLSPMLPKLIQYKQQSIGRHTGFLQQNINMADSSKSPLIYYVDQIKLLYQDYTTGENYFSAESLWGITLDPIVQLLSGLGILLLIIQTIRKKGNPFWLIIIFTFCVQLIIPLVILYRTASVWRAYIVLPIIYIFAVFSIAQIAKFLKFITKKIYKRKGLRKSFLIGLTILYFILCIPWFVSFSKVYLRKSTGYESLVCQYAANLIYNNIPQGSTIYMPDEMCSPLISILYEDNRYRIIAITPDNLDPIVDPGSYLIVFNSQDFGGYFRENIQKIAERILTERKVQLVSTQLTSRPVIYLIK
jgi:hypothetical protein